MEFHIEHKCILRNPIFSPTPLIFVARGYTYITWLALLHDQFDNLIVLAIKGQPIAIKITSNFVFTNNEWTKLCQTSKFKRDLWNYCWYRSRKRPFFFFLFLFPKWLLLWHLARIDRQPTKWSVPITKTRTIFVAPLNASLKDTEELHLHACPQVHMGTDINFTLIILYMHACFTC